MKVALPTPVALFGTILILAGLPTAKAEVDFTRDIRPLLSGKCFACHGPDEDARAGGLGLDEFSAAT